jgi:hypothetical protein
VIAAASRFAQRPVRCTRTLRVNGHVTRVDRPRAATSSREPRFRQPLLDLGTLR